MATFAHGRADSINKRTGKLAEGSPSDVAKRREMVASLRLRGATYLEIREILAANGIINHTRGKPWSKSAIFDDIQAARTQWLTNAAADVKEHYSRILAELEELKKSAWSTGDLTTVLRAISQECKILGLNSPVKVELSLTETDKKADEVLGQRSVEICVSPGCDRPKANGSDYCCQICEMTAQFGDPEMSVDHCQDCSLRAHKFFNAR